MSTPSTRSRSCSLSLLGLEQCVLAGICGVCFSREPWIGAVFGLLACLFFLDRRRVWLLVLPLALSFLAGAGYATLRTPLAPPLPAWLDQAVRLKDDPVKGQLRGPPVRLRARVRSVQPLNEDRLRIILEDLTPALTGGPESAGRAGFRPGVQAADLRTNPAKGSFTVTDRFPPFPDGPQGRQAIPAPANPLPSLDPGGPPEPAWPGGLVWTWRQPEFHPLPGDRLELTLRPLPVRGMANPGLWDLERYWADRRVWLRAWSQGPSAGTVRLEDSAPSLPARWREGLRRDFLEALLAGTEPGEELSRGRAILPALVFGDRSLLTRQDADLFARSTLAHSLALSGLHLGYAVAVGYLLAWLAAALRPGLLERLPLPRLGLLFGLPLALVYLWIGQLPVSLARAFLMLGFGTLLLFLNRPRVVLGGLLAAVAALLAIDPAALFDISLQLSALSVAVIALALPTARRLAAFLFPAPDPEAGPPLLTRLLRGACLLLFISLAIQAALWPLLVRTFGSAGLLFPLNLLWLPALGAWVMPLAFTGLALAGLGLAAPAAWALGLAALPGDALFGLLGWLDRQGLLAAPVVLRPHWLTIAGYWTLGLALCRAPWKAWPGRTGRHSLALCLLGLTMICGPLLSAWAENRNPGVRLRMLDVGQSQAVLLEWSGLGPGRTSGRALIDGGGFANFDTGQAVVAPALTDNALPRLDLVINSHPDLDHLGGLIHILRHFSVGRYYGNADRPSDRLDRELEAALAGAGLERGVLAAGDRLSLAPGLDLEVLWPERPRPANLKGNAASLVVRLVWEGRPLALLCGDTDTAALNRLAGSGADLRAGVLVVAHHGSAGSHAPEFYEAVGPVLALASCGWGNQWGFVRPVVRASLAGQGVKLLTTAEHGQIRVDWAGSGQMAVVWHRQGKGEGKGEWAGE